MSHVVEFTPFETTLQHCVAMLRLERSFAIRNRPARSAMPRRWCWLMKNVLYSIAPACDESVDFRRTMRHLAGGVSILTVGQGYDITGMTVTSVASLSVDPPSL